MPVEYFVCTGQAVAGAPDRIKLLPLGLVHSQRGDFYVDAESFQEMQNTFRSRGIDIVIDYEHQTLHDVQAPAGGWIKELFLEDDAISARVEWTPQARQYLENKEYKYLSPVVMVRKNDKKAVVLQSAALTNLPAIDNMFPIVNAMDMAQFNQGGKEPLEFTADFVKLLCQLLGLGEDATQEQITEAVQNLSATASQAGEVVANKTILDLLGVPATAKTEDVAAAILKYKAPSSQLETEFKALKAKMDQRDADDAVSKAFEAGKLVADQKDWAIQYALKDPAGFTAFIEKAPAVVPTGKLNLEPIVNKDGVILDDVGKSVMGQLGVTKEDLEKYGKDEA